MRRLRIVVLFSLFALPLRAQSVSDTTEKPTSGFVKTLLGIGAYVMTVPIHEFGHYVAASAFGAHPYMDFVPFRYGPTAIAATVFDDSGFTRTQEGIAAIAGVFSSRLLAEAANGIALSLPHDSKYPSATETFMSFLYLFGRLDFPGYVLQDAYSNLEGQSGGDMDILVTQMAGHDAGRRVLGYVGLLSIAALDIVLDMPRILYHVATITGIRMSDKDAHWGAWGLRVKTTSIGGLKMTFDCAY
jgi:hypothetical protein